MGAHGLFGGAGIATGDGIDDGRMLLDVSRDHRIGARPLAQAAPDLVAAHLALQELATTTAGEPVRDILSANPGFAPSTVEGWDYVAFKGGISVGVLAGSWYVEKGDEAYVITIQSSTEDPAALVDQSLYFGQVEDALTLLAD